MFKTCNKCRKSKPLDCFYRKREAKDGLYSICKECKDTYTASRVSANRSYMQRMKEKPCSDCGNVFPPYCMDFDHLRDKEFVISNNANTGLARLQAEIDKCDVVCANCHRIRTHKRANNA